MSQVSEETILEAGLSRTISLSPKYNSELNSQPVKVAIIVDNSHTMASSQENLARNLSSLFSEISKYDADVTVLSTSWRDYLEAKTNTVTISSTVKKQVNTSNFNLSLAPTWKISKSATVDTRNTLYQQIGNKVKQLGVSGNDVETPLQTLAFAIDGMPDFFTQDSRLLVYIISDEDDSSMSTFVTKYYEARITSGQLVPVTRYFATMSYQRFTVITQGTRPEYQDGILVGYIEYDRRTPVATAALCQAKNSPPDSVCEIENVVNERTETSANYCEVMPGTLGYLFSSCVISSETSMEVSNQTTVVRDDSLFYITRTQHGTLSSTTVEGKAMRRTLLLNGLRDNLNSKFQENYLIAAQVNLANQACALGAGHSVATKLQELGTVLPAGQFMASSICDSSATSGLGLKKISERLETIISKTYRLIKAQNEVIKAVRIVTADKKVILSTDQYKFEGGKIELIDSSLTNFDRLEVDLTSI